MSWWAKWRQDPRAEDLSLPMLHLAVELVEMGEAKDLQTRDVLVGALLDTLVAQQRGSTRIPVDEPLQQLASDGVVPSLLATSEHAYKPLIVTDGWLYHQRTLHYERELARLLRARLALPTAPVADDVLDEIVSSPTTLKSGLAIHLSEGQQAAVRKAMALPLTVITGGPGTGKTSIVVSLMRALVRAGVAPQKIALAAPTGKAANRLGGSIDSQLASLDEPTPADARLLEERLAPVTLHRLLKYSGTLGRFRRDETDPIDADWVIVDEASMIDLVLMERLVRCVPETARLVLLGDVEQLPSVETGTVLRDLIRGDDDEHVARLMESFRMDPSDPAGRAILMLAGQVRDGEKGALQRADPTGVKFVDVPRAVMRPKLLDFVDEWFEQRITALDDFVVLAKRNYKIDEFGFDDESQAAIGRLFAHFESFRILCLTRVFASGAEALNSAFHLRMARVTGADGIPDHIGGEPVMMLRNDYERELFNGDQGLVVWVESPDEPPRLAAVFPGDDGFEAHHLSGLSGQLAHSWAMTVHKSQGSEFDDVTLVLPEEDVPLLSRELLYTAITRARRSVTVFGDAELFDIGAARAVERWSGLSERVFG